MNIVKSWGQTDKSCPSYPGLGLLSLEPTVVDQIDAHGPNPAQPPTPNPEHAPMPTRMFFPDQWYQVDHSKDRANSSLDNDRQPARKLVGHSVEVSAQQKTRPAGGSVKAATGPL
jgi:hypothetical protein